MGQSIPTITFISTVHIRMGKCNADELCSILNGIKPEVIFLEALENTYSNYEKMLFLSFGICHQKLEIEAIQKYSNYSSIDYVPVLDTGLSPIFNNKYNRICKYYEHQEITDEFNSMVSSKGFSLLNSRKGMLYHQEMRKIENRLLNDNELDEAVKQDIDAYENSMLKSIYIYCQNNLFDRAVFMCGSAHRQSIIQKIKYMKNESDVKVRWEVYGN